ncbi:hypothetical protein M2273_003099 [Mucilaginibacter lappiensis]|jgi:hypothetical protein
MGILIKAQLLVPEAIVLNTTDNGWGPPPRNFNLAKSSSFEMEMMKASANNWAAVLR